MAATVCSCYRSDIDELWDEIDKLNDSKVATLAEQVEAIETSLSNLETICDNLDGYISTLQTQASSLESTLSEIDADISQAQEDLATLESSLSSVLLDTTSAIREQLALDQAELLASLAALRTSVSEELDDINEKIASLQTMSSDLESRIEALESLKTTVMAYITEALEDSSEELEAWANGTLLTLEQYYELSDSVASLTTALDGINNSLQDLADSVANELRSEITENVESIVSAYLSENASEIFVAALQETVDNITTSYTEAISTAKDEITAAYTTYLATAIDSLESSMTSWVSSSLEDYYTISQTDALLSELQEDLESQLSVKKAYLETLISVVDGSLLSELQANLDSVLAVVESNSEDIATLKETLSDLKSEGADVYNDAVKEAISEFEGTLTTAISEFNEKFTAQIEEVNASISSLEEKVEALTTRVDTIESAIEELQETISDLLARIQSIAYIPVYSDGYATANYSTSDGTVVPGDCVLEFDIRPVDAASALTQVWESALSVKMVSTSTRSTLDETALTVSSVTADSTGVLTVTLSGEGIPDEFYNGEIAVSVCLEISDGNNTLSSDYVGLFATCTDSVDYPYVDLGLSVKWATYNVGANYPYEYGDHFAWGETSPKDSYTEDNSVTYYNPVSDFSGYARYDAATANWGSDWRMPTYDEVNELCDSLTWSYSMFSSSHEVYGLVGTASNGNTIFIPMAEEYYDSSSTSDYRAGIWSSTPSTTIAGYMYAYYFFLKYTINSSHSVGSCLRYWGLSVRAVYDPGDDDEE